MEGGQGLIDIISRIKAFRLQTAQRFLYGEDVSWFGVACGLLRRAGKMGFDRQLFLMDINKLDLTGVVSSISVTGYSGGGVTIRCKYDRGYAAYVKYFCKGQWSDCTDQIKTDEKYKWVRSGRFFLYDDTRSEVFTVTIRDLKEQDSDTYWCGTERVGKDLYTEVNLKVIRGQQIKSVRGYSGGNIIIIYKYGMKHKNHVKVCKTRGQCFYPTITSRAAGWEQDRRFSVQDDRSAGLLRVFIRDLNENDSGEYYIIVKVSEEYSFFSEFNLIIRDDDCCVKSISLSAAAGGSVNISCKYPQSHISDVKFLCWRSGADLCAEETSVKESRRWSPEGKIQLYDDREEQLLTGSISHVTEQDSEYWCGVQSDQGHKSFITRVLIHVTEINNRRASSTSPPSSSLPSSSPSTSSPSSSSSSSSPPSSSPQSSLTSSSPSPSSSSPPSSSSSSSSSSSVESPAISSVSPVTGSSLVVSVSVVLLLIIIGLVFVIWTVCRRRQSNTADSSSDRSHTTPGSNEAVSHTDCDYENIKNIHRMLPTNPSDSSNTVYATPQLPTNLSDSSNTVYATPQLPTNPSDSSNTVYATPQLPTNPSDSSNTVYATPQLPTNLSDSSDNVYANV
ncbi:polymeric immunoglobulin receptor-like [Chanodichthys erythropterus]|uniref:polymeric immunoglobulin receptor-like n=1 Tax=Chanodichthys erythropterus TaxID=933992 RepID=UPI00351EB7E7